MRGLSILIQYTPEMAETITGVPKEEIRRAARIYASENRAMLFYSMCITQHTTGVDNVHACANLVMLTAHVGHAISGLNPLRGQNTRGSPLQRCSLKHLQKQLADVVLPGVSFAEKVPNIPPAEVPDSEFPFVLTTGRNYFQYHTGTMSRKITTLEREEPECIAEINPGDASALGILTNPA